MNHRKNWGRFLLSLAVSSATVPLAPIPARALDQETQSGNIIYADWQDQKQQRTLPVKVYLPTTGHGPYPVIIFSHGLGGSREAATYLGNYWSQHGYVGVFVQHPGSDSEVWKAARGQGRETILTTLRGAANAKNSIYRALDIKFVLDELAKANQADAKLKGKLDLSKIGLAGHSFGAGTTLVIAGRYLGEAAASRGINLDDSRVKCAIYLCPPVSSQAKADPGKEYGKISIPGMLLTGTEDASPFGETTPEDRRIPFDGIKSKHQYLINFTGANHAVFAGSPMRATNPSDEKFHKMTEELTTKFLDATLKGDASAWKWLDSGGAKAFVGDAGKFERK